MMFDTAFPVIRETMRRLSAFEPKVRGSGSRLKVNWKCLKFKLFPKPLQKVVKSKLDPKGKKRSGSLHSAAKAVVSWSLIAALTIQPALLHAQSITVVGDDSGPRPRVDEAYNGTPVLNINTPNGAGVSHDVYTNFNANDLIINNSATIVDTQIGGYVEGNPNLTPGNGARLWIGEVVGGNQTQINGILEVAGKRLDVVLANEFGITCNGCGFVNTGRATLTTGKPRFGSDGSLAGFDVKQGTVTITGNGLNPEGRLALSDTSRVDVIARAAHIFGALRADQANIVAGANIVDYNWSYDPETGAVTGITEQTGEGAAPALAVDVAALGGMYANAITMVATENGVGVRLDGEMASSADIALRADGQLTLGPKTGAHTPQIKARERIRIRNQGPLLLEGAITSENGNLVDIRTSSGALTFTGEASSGAIVLESAGLANIAGAIEASGALQIRSISDAVVLANGSELSAASIDIDAITTATLNGKASASGAFDVTAGTNITTSAGSEITAGDITLEGARIATNGVASARQDVTLTAGAGGAENSGSLSGANITATSAAGLRNGGKIAAREAARLNAAGSLETGSGSELFGRDLTVSGAFATLDGVLNVERSLDVVTTIGNLFVVGTLAGDTTAVRSAGELTNAGTIIGDVSAVVTATDALVGQAGSELSGGDITLSGERIAAAGTVFARGALDVDAGTGGLENTGTVIGNVATLNSDAGLLNRGSVTGSQSAALTAATALQTDAGSALYGGNVELAGASIVTNGVLNVQQLTARAGADGLLNTGTLSGQIVELFSDSAVGNTGTVSAGDQLLIEAVTDVTNAGTLISGNDAAIYADRILNNGGVIWANDSITLAKNDALDRASLIQNTNGRVEAFQGDLTLRADEAANIGTAPTINSQIIKSTEQGNADGRVPSEQILQFIDPAFLGADGQILPAHAAAFTILWAEMAAGGTSLSPAAVALLKPSVVIGGGTAIAPNLIGFWTQTNTRSNIAGIPDLGTHVASIADPAIFDASGNVLPQHAEAYAALWQTLASGVTEVTDPAVQSILLDSAFEIESQTTDPMTGVVTTVYSDTLRSDNTAVWAAISAGSGASYDIVNILYQDRFNDDGVLAEFVAGGSVDIEANTVRNIFGNISAGQNISITADTVENRALGAAQVLVQVHKRPDCFTCHEGNVDYYDTFGGRIEAVGNVNITGNLTNLTLNSSDLDPNDVIALMNQYIAEQQAAGDPDLAGVPGLQGNNAELHDNRSDNFTAPVAGNGTDIREVVAVDTGSQTTVDTGSGTPNVIPVDSSGFATSVETAGTVVPTLTPTASVDELLVAGLNTIAETNPEFTEYSNFITSNYMMDVDRLQYRDELVNNTIEATLDPIARANVTADPGDLSWLNRPVRVPNPDGSGLHEVYPSSPDLALQPDGALISGRNVAISGGTIDNSGAVLASVDASITANTIIGSGGSIVAETGEAALTALGRIYLEDTRISGKDVDIIAGQDFVGKAVAISSEADTSIFAVSGVTLSALTNEYKINRKETYTVLRTVGRDNDRTITETVTRDLGMLTAKEQRTSSLTVGGDLSIVTSADLALAGLKGIVAGDTTLNAGDNLNLLAVQSEIEYHQGNARNGTDYHYITSHVTELSSGGDFVATAGGDATLVGAQIEATGTARLAAGGDVILAAAQDIKSFETRKSKSGFLSRKSESHSKFELTHQEASIAAGGQLDVIAETGDLISAGAALKSSNGDINLTAIEGDIYAGSYTDVFKEEHKKSRSFLGGLISKSSQLNTINQYNTGTSALAHADLSLVSGADTTLVGATLSAGQNLNINTGGDFSVQAAIDSERSEFFETNMGLVTMTTITETSFVETAVLTRLLAGQAKNFDIGGEAELVLYNAAGVDAPNPQDLYPEELLAIEGLQLLNQELANEYFYDKQTSLSPAFKALVAIALSVTGVGAAAATALGTSGAVATGVSSFINSALVGSLDGIVSGDFDISEILEGAAFSGLTAGLTDGIDIGDLGIDLGTAGTDSLIPGFGSGQLSLTGLLDAGLDGVLSSGINSAVYGTDFGAGVLNSVVTYVANGVAGSAIEEVADVYGHDTFSIEKLVAKATINCIAAEAKGASCASGAVGSLVAETLAKGAVASGEPLSAEDLEQLEKNIQLVSAIAGFFTSGGKAENVYATNVAAQLDHDNNWVWFAVRAGVFAWTVYEVVDAANTLNGEFDRLFGDGELTEAEAQELQEAAAAVGINIVFEVTAGKVVKGMKIASVAGDFSVSVAKRLGLDKVLADLNRKFDGVGRAPNKTDWTPPSNFQRPATDKGSFVGQEGNSAFQLSDAAADKMGVPRGSVVQWKQGVPDFDDFAVAGPQGHPKSFEVTGMTGSPSGDRRLMIDSIAETTGMSKRSVERWLRSNDVRLHHAGGNQVQIVPEPVHRLHHSGGAAKLRNGK